MARFLIVEGDRVQRFVKCIFQDHGVAEIVLLRSPHLKGMIE